MDGHIEINSSGHACACTSLAFAWAETGADTNTKPTHDRRSSMDFVTDFCRQNHFPCSSQGPRSVCSRSRATLDLRVGSWTVGMPSTDVSIQNRHSQSLVLADVVQVPHEAWDENA